MKSIERQSQDAGIAGACLLIAFVVIPALAYASTGIRIYGPPARDWLLTHTSEVSIGLVLASCAFGAWLLVAEWIDRA